MKYELYVKDHRDIYESWYDVDLPIQPIIGMYIEFDFFDLVVENLTYNVRSGELSLDCRVENDTRLDSLKVDKDGNTSSTTGEL